MTVINFESREKCQTTNYINILLWDYINILIIRNRQSLSTLLIQVFYVFLLCKNIKTLTSLLSKGRLIIHLTISGEQKKRFSVHYSNYICLDFDANSVFYIKSFVLILKKDSASSPLFKLDIICEINARIIHRYRCVAVIIIEWVAFMRKRDIINFNFKLNNFSIKISNG